MRTYKTKTANRTTYTYKFYSKDGKVENITLRPRESGVTEVNIKTLHALDDSEVYYNNKNLKPKRTEEEKAEIEKWKEDYIKREMEYSDSIPSDEEVNEAAERAFPKNYNLSLDYIFGDSEADTDFDKSKLMHKAALQTQMEESYATLRIRELMEEMTDKQREVLQLVDLDGWTLTEVSKRMGISVKNVSKHRNNARKYIEENFYK